MKKTKIVCTLGPSTDDEKVLRALIMNGMNVARLNFSHGVYEEHKRRIDTLKKIRDEMNVPVAIMLDTKGPEIRVRDVENGQLQLVQNQKIGIVGSEEISTNDLLTVTYNNIHKVLKKNNRILIDDGLIELIVDEIVGKVVYCTVINGGIVKSKKGVNLPGVELDLPYISEKDKADIFFGIENDVDFVAASFARTSEDVLQIRRLLDQNGGRDIEIIAKIENAQGVENASEILKIADGLMVARGDLGVEIPFEQIPKIQKDLIKMAYVSGKKVITATQMLESMINNPRPTRAETNDVANAVYDGTSAVMLSGETAVGKYPVESVINMNKIVVSTEETIHYKKRFDKMDLEMFNCNITNAISHATCTTAHDLNATCIITVTKSGFTARAISKYRPACIIVGCTTDKKVYHKLALSWGILPVMAEEKVTTDELFDHAVDLAIKNNVLHPGELCVITAGVPLGISGTTNILKVVVV